MKKSKYMFLLLLLVFSMSSIGCARWTLIRPEANFTPSETIDHARLANLKFSYQAFYPINQDLRRAFADSFTTLGIRDAVESDSILPNRIHVVVYQLARKPKPSFFESWAIISMLTFTIIPIYEEEVASVEIHIIDMNRPIDKQFNLVSKEVETASLLWMPLGLMLGTKPSENVQYMSIFAPPQKDKVVSLNYLAYRRILDEVLWNVAKDKIRGN